MTTISVDPAALHRLSERLVDAGAVAAEVHHQGGSLQGHLGAEHPAVQHAARSFLERWAWGCECLVADTSELSARLQGASQCYVQVDESAAAAFSP